MEGGTALERAVFEHLPVAAMVVDRRRSVLAVNREARRLFSPIEGKLVGRTCRELGYCSVPDAQCPAKRAMGRRCPIPRAQVTMHFGGRRRTVIERVTPFTDRDTGEQRAAIVFADATRYLRRFRLIHRDARIDHHTGALNRNCFEAAYARALRADRRRLSRAFLMIDVDGLKRINDDHGHETGDRLLRALGRALRREVRRSDLLGRLGGDEFGVYCPNTTWRGARRLVARIRKAIAAENAAHSDRPALRVGIGVAASKGPDFNGLRKEADARLCAYKKRLRVGR